MIINAYDFLERLNVKRNEIGALTFFSQSFFVSRCLRLREFYPAVH